MAENLPNLTKETDTQVQKAQRVPNKMYINRLTLPHTVIKMDEVQERNLKAAKEK